MYYTDVRSCLIFVHARVQENYRLGGGPSDMGICFRLVSSCIDISCGIVKRQPEKRLYHVLFHFMPSNLIVAILQVLPSVEHIIQNTKLNSKRNLGLICN